MHASNERFAFTSMIFLFPLVGSVSAFLKLSASDLRGSVFFFFFSFFLLFFSLAASSTTFLCKCKGGVVGCTWVNGFCVLKFNNCYLPSSLSVLVPLVYSPTPS